MPKRKVLVTGAAGFIGFHLARRLLKDGWQVVGLDNINDYYSVTLKEDRLKMLMDSAKFRFHRVDLADAKALTGVFEGEGLDGGCPVVHLAAQAGVRYGLEHPEAYIQSNLIGFFNVLEACRAARTPHLLYASSSSVYGGNTRLPFSVHDNVDHPVSLYAATKKSNELLAHVYSHTYDLPTTGLRFFTVYGPWGRPDMALFLFTKAILKERPIEVFNYGEMQRDFTYIDDIIEAVVRLIDKHPQADEKWDAMNPDPATSSAPYRVFNLGNHRSEQLMEFISIIEETLGRKAEVTMKPMQTGDVPATFADVDDLAAEVGFAPKTTIREGIPKFIEWFLDYYGYAKDGTQ